MLAAVFLDLGNTLLRERTSRAEIYAKEARSLGFAVDVEQMAACMARAHAELPREWEGAFRYSDRWFKAFQERVFVRDLGFDRRRFDELSGRLFARFETAETFVLFDGARELLASLRRANLGVGLISNWSERLPRLLRALRLESDFDFVLGSAALRAEKPERAIFEVALAHAKAPANRCLHAGDSWEKDVLGARAAGIPAVLVDHGGTHGSEARGACPVARDLLELQDLILRYTT
jgi:putative hydrolase of the HAD superfamily